METALTVVAYAFAGALVISAVGFALLCLAMRGGKKDLDRSNAEHDERRERTREEIDRGARRMRPGGRL